jgi:hypothetical protein
MLHHPGTLQSQTTRTESSGNLEFDSPPQATISHLQDRKEARTRFDQQREEPMGASGVRIKKNSKM